MDADLDAAGLRGEGDPFALFFNLEGGLDVDMDAALPLSPPPSSPSAHENADDAFCGEAHSDAHSRAHSLLSAVSAPDELLVKVEAGDDTLATPAVAPDPPLLQGVPFFAQLFAAAGIPHPPLTPDADPFASSLASAAALVAAAGREAEARVRSSSESSASAGPASPDLRAAPPRARRAAASSRSRTSDSASPPPRARPSKRAAPADSADSDSHDDARAAATGRAAAGRGHAAKRAATGAPASGSRKKGQPLTDEQKEQRVKERMARNRAAAQESRDRKKAHYVNLEATNAELQSTNASLISRVAALERDNADLAARLTAAVAWAAGLAASAISTGAAGLASAPAEAPLDLPRAPPAHAVSALGLHRDPFLSLPASLHPSSAAPFTPTPAPVSGLGDPAAVPLPAHAPTPSAFDHAPPSPVSLSPPLSPVNFADLVAPGPELDALEPLGPAAALPAALALLPGAGGRRSGAAAWLDARVPLVGAAVAIATALGALWDAFDRTRPGTWSLADAAAAPAGSRQRTPETSRPPQDPRHAWVLDPPAEPRQHPWTLAASALLALAASWGASTARRAGEAWPFRGARGGIGGGAAGWTTVVEMAAPVRARAHRLPATRPWWSLGVSPTLSASPLARSLARRGPVPSLALRVASAAVLTLFPLAFPAARLLLGADASASPYRTAASSWWSLPAPLAAALAPRRALSPASSKFGRSDSPPRPSGSTAGARGSGSHGSWARWGLGKGDWDWTGARWGVRALAPVAVSMGGERGRRFHAGMAAAAATAEGGKGRGAGEMA